MIPQQYLVNKRNHTKKIRQLANSPETAESIIKLTLLLFMYKYEISIDEITKGIGKPKNIMEKSQSGGLLTHPNTSNDTMKKDKAEIPDVIIRSRIPNKIPSKTRLLSYILFAFKL